VTIDAWITLDDAADRSMERHGHVTDAVARTWLEMWRSEVRAGREPPHRASHRLAVFLARGRGRECPRWQTHMRRARRLTEAAGIEVHPVQVAGAWAVSP
jgi:hypothetical protein